MLVSCPEDTPSISILSFSCWEFFLKFNPISLHSLRGSGKCSTLLRPARPSQIICYISQYIVLSISRPDWSAHIMQGYLQINHAGLLPSRLGAQWQCGKTTPASTCLLLQPLSRALESVARDNILYDGTFQAPCTGFAFSNKVCFAWKAPKSEAGFTWNDLMQFCC